MQALIPWQWVRVVGYSMTPTLLPGDWVLVRHRAAVRPGAIVLGRFRQRPDLAVIKRAVGERDGGWLLASDNAGEGSDSRQYGVADVQATAVRIWHRGAPSARSVGLSAGRGRALRRRWWGSRPAEFTLDE